MRSLFASVGRSRGKSFDSVHLLVLPRVPLSAIQYRSLSPTKPGRICALNCSDVTLRRMASRMILSSSISEISTGVGNSTLCPRSFPAAASSFFTPARLVPFVRTVLSFLEKMPGIPSQVDRVGYLCKLLLQLTRFVKSVPPFPPTRETRARNAHSGIRLPAQRQDHPRRTDPRCFRAGSKRLAPRQAPSSP